MINFEHIVRIVSKETSQMLRDPRMRAVLFVLPVIQLFILGIAVSSDVRRIDLAIVDQDYSVESRDLLARIGSSGYFRTVATGNSMAVARENLNRGRADAVIEVPRGFAEDLRRGRGAGIALLLDGTDPQTSGAAGQYVAGIVNDWARRGRAGAIEARTRIWFNPELESRQYNMPGVIGVILLLAALLLTAMAVVREREIGTLDQLMVTPLSPMEFILGKTLPFLIVGLIDLLITTLLAVVVFDVPFRGSLLVLVAGAVLFLGASLSIGLIISSLSNTQQEALMTTFFIYFPSVLLSGFMFPVRQMPAFFQHLTVASPLTHFLVVLRGVFLKGSGFVELAQPLTALAVLLVVFFALAVTRMKRVFR